MFRLCAAGCAAALICAVSLAPLSTVMGDHRDEPGQAGFASQHLVADAANEEPLDLSFSLFEDTSADTPEALYSLAQFMSKGVVNWGGYRFTYYSQRVLPGGGLAIPGRHVSEAGYVSDADGYIVLAGSAPKGTVYETPFGAQGKIYDRGTVGNHLDVYVR